MKRIITLSGPGGRAVLTLGEEIKLSVSAQGLYFADRQGKVYPREAPPKDIIGAFIMENGRITMQGCLAGQSSALAKAKTALLLSRPPREQPIPAPAHQKPAPLEQPPRSAQLMEILQKAAELFPPEPPKAASSIQPQPAGDTVANPFPREFPFSRWRRVEYPGTDRCYLEGEARMRGVDYVIHALPASRPNGGPPGYSRFLRARDGSGFWVRVRRK